VPTILEQGFAQPQPDRFHIGDALSGQILANQLQESGGFLELFVGDRRGLSFFFRSAG
jgi:hypothetical protein